MKMKVQAQHLQPGDIVGSGEKVIHVSAGTHTPKGKIDVCLIKNNVSRWTIWGKYTIINVDRAEKTV